MRRHHSNLHDVLLELNSLRAASEAPAWGLARTAQPAPLAPVVPRLLLVRKDGVEVLRLLDQDVAQHAPADAAAPPADAPAPASPGTCRSAPVPYASHAAAAAGDTGLSSITSRRFTYSIICATVTDSSSTFSTGRAAAAPEYPETPAPGPPCRRRSPAPRLHASRNSPHPRLRPRRLFDLLLLQQHLRRGLEALMLQQPLHQLAPRVFGVRPRPSVLGSRGSSVFGT